MAKLDFTNKWVLVTGASSGLGKAMALHLAKEEHAHLVITGRRKEALEILKKEIQAAGYSSVIVIQADLSCRQEVENLFAETIALVDLYALINNAGITYYGKTNATDMETFEKMMQVNFNASMILTLRCLELFAQKGSGAILNITSEAAFVPIPYQAVYSAGKHALQSFTTGLCMENKHGGVVIASFAPGGISTNMLHASGLDKKKGVHGWFTMSPEKAAKLAVKTFKKKKMHSFPGLINKLTLLLNRFLPRKWVAHATERIYRPI